MEKEVYSYMITTIDLLSKSIMIQDQKNLKLFSYLYNNYADLNNRIQNYHDNIQNLSYFMTNFDQKLQKVEFRIGKIDKKIDKMIAYINDTSNNKIKIEEEPKPNIFYRIYSKIKNFFNIIYQSIYKVIFRNKLKKIEEEKILKQKKEEQNKILQQKLAVKKILNNHK